MRGVYTLGSVSIALLVGSGAYLWHLLRGVSLPRRALNMLLPLSQVAFVAYALSLSAAYEYGPIASQLSSLVGIACAIGNPLLYRSLLDAEHLELERERAQFLEEQTSLQERHLEETVEAGREASEIRTRLDRELALLEDALADGSAETAERLLDDAERVVQPSGEHVCEHQAADALIVSKLRHARESGIRASVRAEIPLDLPTPAVELCAVLANALDNAINACSELPEEERWIKMDARPSHGLFLVDVTNPCRHGSAQGKVHKGRGALPEHGWGLSIIDAIARRHGGSLKTSEKDGAFRLSAAWGLQESA